MSKRSTSVIEGSSSRQFSYPESPEDAPAFCSHCWDYRHTLLLCLAFQCSWGLSAVCPLSRLPSPVSFMFSRGSSLFSGKAILKESGAFSQAHVLPVLQAWPTSPLLCPGLIFLGIWLDKSNLWEALCISTHPESQLDVWLAGWLLETSLVQSKGTRTLDRKIRDLYLKTLLPTTKARKWDPPGCPSTDGWLMKTWSMYVMEFYLDIKKMNFAERRMELKNISTVT